MITPEELKQKIKTADTKGLVFSLDELDELPPLFQVLEDYNFKVEYNSHMRIMAVTVILPSR